MKRPTNLLDHITHFCRFLRKKGFSIGASQEMDVLEGLSEIAWKSSEEFKGVLKATLVKNEWQFKQFDDLFFEYWAELSRAVDSKQKKLPDANKPSKPPSVEVIKEWLYGNKNKESKKVSYYDGILVKGRADLSMFSGDSLKDWYEVIRIISNKMSEEKSRRIQEGKEHTRLYLRQTIRKNMRRGGELLELAYEKPKKIKTNIVILADVSKSMEIYSRELIQMMYSFQNSKLHIETFVFSTSLYRLTKQLKSGDYKKVLKSIPEEVDEWAGGTRIGESLWDFYAQFGNRLLNSKTFVFIVSDGLDNGEVEYLRKAMVSIKKRAKKIFWFNPLAKSPNFTIQTQGMLVAKNHIDYLIPATGVADFKRFLSGVKL